MRTQALLLALLTLTALASCWTANFTPPSCMAQYTVAGKSFTLAHGNESFSCTASTEQVMGVIGVSGNNLNTTIFGAYNTTSIRLWGTSSAGSGQALDITNIPLPSSGNYTTESGTQGSGSFYIYCAGDTATKISATAAGQLNLTEINTTHYQMNNSTFLLNCSRSSWIGMHGQPGNPTLGWISYPKANVSSWNEALVVTNDTGSVHIQTPSYSSQHNNTIVRSDLFTGWANMSILNTSNYSNYCKGSLFYTYPGYMLILPELSYIPNENAFADFYDTTNSSGLSYFKNATPMYLLDTDSGRWYYLAPTTCTDFSTPTSAALSFFSTAGTTPTLEWAFYNGSTASLAGGRNYCNGTNGTTETPIKVRVASLHARSYQINLTLNNSTVLLSYMTPAVYDEIYSFPGVNGSTWANVGNATNVTVAIAGDPPFAMLPIEQHCSWTLTKPAGNDKGVLVMLAILMVALGAAFEMWLGMGFLAFSTGMVLLGATIASGLVIPAGILFISLIFELTREMKK